MNFFSRILRPKELTSRVEQSRDRLYRVAFAWCHDAALADDLVQDTLHRALRKSEQLRDPALLDSWLFSILANCLRDHFRAQRHFEDIDEIVDTRCADHATPEYLHARTQIVERVRCAVEKLPLGQRQVLVLVDLEEFSYAEVAEILDIPVGTVMSRLCRARRALKELLSEAPAGETTQDAASGGEQWIRRIK